MPIPETMPVDPDTLRALLSALLVVMSPVLFMTAVWALLHCFLGYFIFRLDLLLAGTYCGAFGSALLLWEFRPAATGLECFLACLVGAALLCAAAWFLYRLTFGLLVAAGALGLALSLSPTPAIGWVFGCLFALGFGALAFLFAKPMWIFLSAVIGAHLAVACTAVVVARGRLLPLVLGARGHWLSVILALIGLALAVGGMVVQVRLSRRVRISLAAEGQPQAKPPPARKRDSPATSR